MSFAHPGSAALSAINPSAFANASVISSRSGRSRGPLRILFDSDWKSSGIMEWHGSRPTKINTLQLRKERSEPFTHQYAILVLPGDIVLRLDRMGDADVPMDAVTRTGTQAVDTIANITSLVDLDKSSDCLVQVDSRHNDVDLSDIIKICFAIHNDEKAQRYTLQRFNCYFFSWTILVVTARHAVPWHMLPFDSPWEELSQTLADTLSIKFTDEVINTISEVAAQILVTLQRRLGPELRRAQSVRARMMWAMPRKIIHFGLWLMARASGRLRMHSVLRSKLHSALLFTLQPTLRSALADLRVSTLRTTLWQDGVGDAMRKAAHRDVMTGVLDAASKALSSIGDSGLPTMDVAEILPSVPIADRDILESRKGGWRTAFVAGLYGAMRVSPIFAAQGDDNFVINDAKWDEAWNSVRDASRDAAKAAMEGEREGAWAAVWEVLWEEWDAGWEASRCRTRDTAREAVSVLAELVNDALADSVVNTLPDTHLHIVVRNMVPSRFRRIYKPKFKARVAMADVTHSGLQRFVLKLIRSHSHVMGRYGLGSQTEVENDMREAMNRIWTAAGMDIGGEGTNVSA